MHHLIVDRFFERAANLRAEFDAKFENPLHGHAGRFVWDFWHVPGEYTHLRTPAYHYFSPKLYAHFHRHLVNWGREHLGCHDISPPWLSSYINGCRQEPHQDVPHGPLAFVYSLTPPRPVFRGGETFIVKPRTLIAPKFNRLTLFNPALTHGVREVKGTMDPREGRLVIHGWFVNPRPFWTGPLKVSVVRDILDQNLPRMDFSRAGSGFGAFRLSIHRDGRVTGARVLVETFNARKAVLQTMLRDFKGWRFPKMRAPATLTVPVRVD